MGVDGVNGLSKGTSYDDSDVEGMKGKESLSTNTLINRVGNHAGLSDTHNVRGRDATGAELVEKHHDEQQERWIKTFVEMVPGGGTPVLIAELHHDLKNGDLQKAIEHGDHEAIEHFAEHMAEKMAEHAGYESAKTALAIPHAIYKLTKAMADSVADDAELGQERKEAVVKSAMHIQILGSLSGLPQDFVNNERSRYLEDKDGVALANKMNAGAAR